MSRHTAAATSLLAAVLVALLVLVQGEQLGGGSGPTVAPKTKTPAGYRTALAEANAELAHRASQQRSDRSDALLLGWLAVAILAGGGIALVVTGRRRPARPRRRVITVPAPADAHRSPDPTGADAGADRQVLVQTCIEVADVIPVQALRLELEDALRAVGVEPVTPPDGSRFDPAVARIVDRLPTADPEQEHHIARTERVGYIDRGRRLRQPEVTVYSLDQVHDA